MIAFHEFLKSDFAITFFGIVATLFCYIVARKLSKFGLFKKVPSIIIGAGILIAIIEITPFSYADYARGGDFVTYLLGPATVALAYPLYQFSRLARANVLEVFSATVISVFTSVGSMILLGYFFGLGREITLSLTPKCVTTPIAIEISKMFDGILGLSVCGVFISGILGAAFGHGLLKTFGVKNDLSIGLAMGATSHVIGTAKCLEISERQAAMSALVLVLTAIFTSCLFSIYGLF